MALRNKDETGAEDTFEKVLAKLDTICCTVEEHFKLEDEPEELHRQELRVSCLLLPSLIGCLLEILGN
jgi:hypothetical protein